MSAFEIRVMACVDASWREMFARNGLAASLAKIISEIAKMPPESFAPAPEHILRWASAPLAQARVVIFGQDPYPSREDACGYAFSAPAGRATIPASLANIYEALRASGELRGAAQYAPLSADLTPWVRQGVLLVNLSHTTSVGKSGSHMAMWRDWTRALVRALSTEVPTLAYILLGAKVSAELGASIVASACVEKWGHPSPLNRANVAGNPLAFVNCKAFARVNDKLRSMERAPIDWTPALVCASNRSTSTSDTAPQKVASDALYTVELAEESYLSPLDDEDLFVASDSPQGDESQVHAFVDGASRANGSANCTAGFAASFVRGEDCVDIAGRVCTPSGAQSGVRPSNNSAELSAICAALEFALAERYEALFGARREHALVIAYDSEYAHSCVCEWYEKWALADARGKTPMEIHANVALIERACALHTKARGEFRSVTWRKVRAHQKRPANSDELFYWAGNARVDALARKFATA